jgi:hypothetical protein
MWPESAKCPPVKKKLVSLDGRWSEHRDENLPCDSFVAVLSGLVVVE